MEKLDYCVRSILTCYRIWSFRKSWYILDEVILDDSFWCFICCLFKNRYNASFFPVIWKCSTFKQFLNILKRGSIIASTFSDIFNMRILIISWPWALLQSSLQMILLISPFMNSMFASYWSVMGLVDEGRTLLFSIIKHCFAKKELRDREK